MSTPVDVVLEQVKLPFALREYQKEDINRLALFDRSGEFADMGLGKTVIAFCIACYKLIKGEFKQCYVVVPASLTRQWYEFITPTGASVVEYTGTPSVREKLDINKNFVIVSYNIFQRDYERLKRDDIFFIFDEATVFCQPQNTMYKLINGGETRKEKKIPGRLKPEIVKKAYPNINRGCVLLTGTPINSPVSAFGLINMKTPGVYSSYYQFERIHVSSKNYFNQPEEYQHMDLLKDNLMLNASRRLITDHIDMPPIVYNTVVYDLSPAHKRLYDKLVSERMLELDGEVLIDSITAQSLYQTTQQIIISPSIGGLKEEAVIFDLLEVYINQVKQFLIFSNYVTNNQAFMKRFDIGGVFGKVSKAAKDNFIEKFKTGELKGLAIHYASGGFGHNFQNCSSIFFSEMPITPRNFRQCVSRCWRSGQLEKVVVTVFVANGTIQQSLLKKIFDKDELSREIVNESGSLEDLLTSNVKEAKITKKELMAQLRGEV